MNKHQAKIQALRYIRALNDYNDIYPFVSMERDVFNKKQKASIRNKLAAIKTIQPGAVSEAWDIVVAEEYSEVG